MYKAIKSIINDIYSVYSEEVEWNSIFSGSEKDCEVFAFMMNQAEENMKENKEYKQFMERYNRIMNNTKAKLFGVRGPNWISDDDMKKNIDHKEVPCEGNQTPKQDLPRGGYF